MSVLQTAVPPCDAGCLAPKFWALCNMMSNDAVLCVYALTTLREAEIKISKHLPDWCVVKKILYSYYKYLGQKLSVNSLWLQTAYAQMLQP